MFKGKNTLVTGGSSGIGKEMVLLFAKEGANVIFTGSREEEKVKSIIQEATSYGTEITYMRADFSKKEEVEKVALKALEKYKAIDILINNAAAITSGLVLDEKIENIEHTMQVNVYAPFQLIKMLCPKMVEKQWGRVINVSSVAGVSFEKAMLAYGMTKTALFALTKTLASELGTTGVTANVIVPGLVDTPMLETALVNLGKDLGQGKDKTLDFFLAKSKTKKIIDPKDVAAYAVFLSSNEAKSITGTLQVIDGGHLI